MYPPFFESPAGAPVYSGHPLDNHPAFEVPLAGDLAVIACHFNPSGYERPRQNMGAFLSWLWALRIPVFMVELTFDGGPAPVLPLDSPRVLQVRTSPENSLWHKEGLLNLAPSIVPQQFRKLAWIDADVIIRHPEWAARASAVLDQTPLIQLFSRAIYTDSSLRESGSKASTGFAGAIRDPRRDCWSHFHCGFAWAARRELWERFGGLYHSIIGPGDSIVALAAMGRLRRDHTHIAPFNEHVYEHARAWGEPVREWTGGNIDCIPADLVHLWHGDHRDRKYMERLEYTRPFNPRLHVAPSASGVTEWTEAARRDHPDMLRSVRDYFTERREDG